MKSAVDITGWSFLLTLANRAGSTIFSQSIGSGITVTEEDPGQILCAVLSALTIGLPVGTYNAILLRTDSGAYTELAILQMAFVVKGPSISP